MITEDYVSFEIAKLLKEEISVLAHDSYSCVKPQNVQSMSCCKTCTSRQPNMCCKFLKIETVYIKD